MTETATEDNMMDFEEETEDEGREEDEEHVTGQNYFSLWSGKRTESEQFTSEAPKELKLRVGVKKFAKECLQVIIWMMC